MKVEVNICKLNLVLYKYVIKCLMLLYMYI